MKSGASDPFADDDADEADDAHSSSAQSPSDSDHVDGGSDPDPSELAAESGEVRDAKTKNVETQNAETQAGETDSGPDADESDDAAKESESGEDGGSEGLSREELPFILRRDKVKDERPEVHQLFVQRETHEEAVDAERALEKRLGEGLSRTDAREAIYLAGMRHLGDAEDILREWGYDL